MAKKPVIHGAAARAQAEGLAPTLDLIAVGVDRYDQPPAQAQLSFPDDDARAIAQAFASLKGKLFGQVVTRVLVNGEGGEEPTVDNIVDALDLFRQAGQYDACHAAAPIGLKHRAPNHDHLAKQLMDETTVVITSCCRTGRSAARPD